MRDIVSDILFFVAILATFFFMIATILFVGGFWSGLPMVVSVGVALIAPIVGDIIEEV